MLAFLQKMEDLQQLFPHLPPDRLLSVLQSCNGQLEDAAALLLENNPELSNPSNEEEGNKQVMHNVAANVNLPADCFTVQLFNKA